MTMPKPERIERAANRIVEHARAIVADPDNMDVRRDYVRATFNLDWTAAAIVLLADRALQSSEAGR